jgi:hypothetical protein
MGLPLAVRKFDSIWVIVHRLTKSAHFILVNTKYRAKKYAEIYIAHVLCLHRVPKTIISNWGSQFVTHFWEQLHATLRTHLIHSLAYHPQMDDQTEQVNQILEDMLRAYVMEYPGSWDKNLPWTEFSYNNSYQESLKMAQFEVFYERRCRTPLNWIESGEKVIFAPHIIDEAEATICRIQDNLKAMMSHQESYANKRHWHLEFEVGDHVYLKVSPINGLKRFEVKEKLAPHYIVPFPILENMGPWHTSWSYHHCW